MNFSESMGHITTGWSRTLVTSRLSAVALGINGRVTAHYKYMNRNQTLNFLLIAFLSFSFFSGCFTRFEVYEFSSENQKFAWGSVGGKIRGKQEIKGFKTIVKSPYDLLVWFHFNIANEGFVKIQTIQLIQSKTKKVLFSAQNLPEEPIVTELKSTAAYYSFDNLTFEHSDVHLSFSFILKQNGKKAKYKADIPFTKSYDKFWRMIGV